MHKTFQPRQLIESMPFVTMLIGSRKMGKSFLCNHFCRLISNQYGLIISFMGSPMCNPTLASFVDPRFLFNQWQRTLMVKLEEQQLELIEEGRPRNVLILVDDIILDSDDQKSLEHLAMRGRHFKVSLMCLSVSWSQFPKNVRRACDFVFLFSLGCKSDRDLLLSEYSQNPSMANFMSSKCYQERHRCLVLSMNQARQEIFFYKAPTDIGRMNTRVPKVCEKTVPKNIDHPSEIHSSGCHTDIPECPVEKKPETDVSVCEKIV